MKKLPLLVDATATGLFLGKIPFMPGTFGSLGAIPIGYAAAFLHPLYKIILGLFLFFIGVIVSNVYVRLTGIQDPSCVVIDEIAALSIIYFIFPFSMFYIISGFIFFRFFDILKPFPIKYFERLPEGWGVMADDMVAAIYAAICCLIIKTLVEKLGLL